MYTEAVVMRRVNVRDTRIHLAELLDAVAAGEEIVILRRGEPAARLASAAPPRPRFRDRSPLRDSLPPMLTPASETVRALRDERG